MIKDELLQDAYAETMLHGLSPDDNATVRDISRSNPGAAALIRIIQIVHESLVIASSSKNKETAEGRMALAESKFQEAMIDYRVLTTQATKDGLQRAFDQEKAIYHKAKYPNVAKGYMAKITPSSTKKTRDKYVALARDEIEQGLADPLADIERLLTLKSMYSHY